MNENELILILVIAILLIYVVYSTVYRIKTAKERSIKEEKSLELEEKKMEIMFNAYSFENTFSQFVSSFKTAPEEIFFDQRIVKVIKEEIKRNFNNVYDFSMIKESIEELPRESRFLFELFFSRVLSEIDSQFLKNLYKQAININDEKIKKELEKIFKKNNIVV